MSIKFKVNYLPAFFNLNVEDLEFEAKSPTPADICDAIDLKISENWQEDGSNDLNASLMYDDQFGVRFDLYRNHHVDGETQRESEIVWFVGLVNGMVLFSTDDAPPIERGEYYLSVYHVYQAYGGPEEGGWFDTIRECVETDMKRTWAEASARKQELEAEWVDPKTIGVPLWRLSGGYYEVLIEDEAGKTRQGRSGYC